MLSLVLSFAVSNAVHPGLGANEELALCDRGGREADFIELISMQDLELRAGLDYESFALFAQAEQLIVVGPRRRHESTTQPNSSDPSSRPVVSQIWLPQTTGEDHPLL